MKTLLIESHSIPMEDGPFILSFQMAYSETRQYKTIQDLKSDLSACGVSEGVVRKMAEHVARTGKLETDAKTLSPDCVNDCFSRIYVRLKQKEPHPFPIATKSKALVFNGIQCTFDLVHGIRITKDRASVTGSTLRLNACTFLLSQSY